MTDVIPGMKAVVRKDRRTGWWCWGVTGHGLRTTGERENWDDALAGALDDLGWIAEHQHAWPPGLAALGWRP